MERGEVRVFFAFGETDDALVGRECRGVAWAEVESDAAEQASVFAHVVGAHLLEAARRCFVQG